MRTSMIKKDTGEGNIWQASIISSAVRNEIVTFTGNICWIEWNNDAVALLKIPEIIVDVDVWDIFVDMIVRESSKYIRKNELMNIVRHNQVYYL